MTGSKGRVTSASAVLCSAAHLQLLHYLLLQRSCLLLLAHRAGESRGGLCSRHLSYTRGLRPGRMRAAGSRPAWQNKATLRQGWCMLKVLWSNYTLPTLCHVQADLPAKQVREHGGIAVTCSQALPCQLHLSIILFKRGAL